MTTMNWKLKIESARKEYKREWFKMKQHNNKNHTKKTTQNFTPRNHKLARIFILKNYTNAKAIQNARARKEHKLKQIPRKFNIKRKIRTKADKHQQNIENNYKDRSEPKRRLEQSYLIATITEAN